MITTIHEPRSCEEAVRLKQRLKHTAVFLAGGTEVNSSRFNQQPNHMISLKNLDLGAIQRRDKGLVIGATCTIQQLLEAADSPLALKKACQNLVNRNIRNIATIGGHIACNRRSSDIIPALVALETRVDAVLIDEEREATFELMELVQGETADALIVGLTIPDDEHRHVAVSNVALSTNDTSVITVAVSLKVEQNRIVAPIVAIGGVAQHIVRLNTTEDELAGGSLPTAEQIEAWVSTEVSPISDIRGTAAFKRHLAGTLVGKTTIEAFHSAGRAS